MSRRVIALLLFALPASAADKTAQELAEQVKPSLCAIVTRGRDVSEKGLGTGFVISADGLIATNAHVTGEGRPIAVEFADGQRYDAVPLVAGAVAAGRGPARAQRVGDGVPARGQDGGGRRGGEPVEGGLGDQRGDGGGQRAGRGWSKHGGRPWAESRSFRNPMLRPRRPTQKVHQWSYGPSIRTEPRRAAMRKVNRVMLTADEPAELEALIRKGTGAARRLARARVLLKADQGADGPA